MKNTSVAWATNLTELLQNESTDALLAVNGFSEKCSDFEWLQRLCVCASRMPNATLVKRCQSALSDFLGEEMPLDLQSCGELWKVSANRLLLESKAKADLRLDFLGETVVPPALRIEPSNTVDVGALLKPRSMRWKAWESEAEKLLESALPKDATPILHLSFATDPKKPNLYRVEQILSGVEKDFAMWQVQSTVFLLRFCESRGIRPILEGDCTVVRMIDFLYLCASFTLLPSLILCPSRGISWNRYVILCEAVRKNRGTTEKGVPPILLCGVERFFEN